MPTTLSLKDVPSTKRLSQVDPRRWLMLAVLLLATFMGSRVSTARRLDMGGVVLLTVCRKLPN